MMTKINTSMLKINNKNGRITLSYDAPIIAKKRYRTTKTGEEKTYITYVSQFPPEFKEYMKIKNETFYFYVYKGKLVITSVKPEGKHRKQKLQVSNQFVIPRKCIKGLNPTCIVHIIMDFGLKDPLTHKEGLVYLKIENTDS